MTAVQQWWLHGQSASSGAIDPFASDVILLLRNRVAGMLDTSVYANPTALSDPTSQFLPGDGPWGEGAVKTTSGVGYVDIAPAYDITVPELVIECWFKADGTDGPIIAWATPGNDVYLGMTTGGGLGLTLQFSAMGAGVVGWGSAVSSIGLWHHIAMIWSNNEDGIPRGTLYHNSNALWSTTSIGSNLSVAGGYINVGRYQGGAATLPGKLGEVRITKAKRYTRYWGGTGWRIPVPTGPMDLLPHEA